MQPISPPTSDKKQSWTVLSLIEWSTTHMVAQGFDEARLHVELLLCHVLNFSRIQLYTNFDRPLTLDELAEFKSLFKRRLTHEPLQYILGKTEFMGLTFEVNSDVLIPRPETELLVELGLEIIKESSGKLTEVLDIGTGSGDIAIAIASLAPHSKVTSIDVSEKALEVARRNSVLNNTQVNFLRCDMMDDFLPEIFFDVIVSNPPYISKDEFTSLQPEVRDFEPRIATTDEGDGFKFIRRLFDLSAIKLANDGALLFEMAFNQSDEVLRLAAKTGLRDARVLPDFAGVPRVFVGRK